MDRATITWKHDTATAGEIAYFEGDVQQVASVCERVDHAGWVLHLHVVPWQRSFHIYQSRDKAIAHATRWLSTRREWVFGKRPKPYTPPQMAVEALRGDPFAPHPGGRKRAFKARRKPF
jgi:hypothetical protein